MSARPLILTAALAATLAFAGCRRPAEEAPAPPPAPAPTAPVTPATAGAPMSYESKNQFASVKLTLPDAIKAQPDLHAALYAAAVRDLRQFVEGAQADRTEAGGDQGQAPYEKTIAFAPGAETGKLFSLRRTDFDFTGGAHPNTQFAATLWDKALKRQIGVRELFRGGADLKPLDQALCDAINAAKRERNPQTPASTLGGRQWACPTAAQTPFVLAGGTAPGKAGGLTFLIGAYQVGPYSDGPYEITVPQSAFRTLLAPAYADEFAGTPAPRPAA